MEPRNPVEYLPKWDNIMDRDLAGWNGAGWYFWDETWTNINGPYNTEDLALEALVKYMKTI